MYLNSFSEHCILCRVSCVVLHVNWSILIYIVRVCFLLHDNMSYVITCPVFLRLSTGPEFSAALLARNAHPHEGHTREPSFGYTRGCLWRHTVPRYRQCSHAYRTTPFTWQVGSTAFGSHMGFDTLRQAVQSRDMQTGQVWSTVFDRRLGSTMWQDR